MNTASDVIEKISDITVEDLQSYIRLVEVDEVEKKFLNTILKVAKDFIKNQTGIVDIDKYSDLIIVVFVLCQDMYDSRTLYVDKSNLNKVVSSILDEHNNNLL